MRLPLYFLLVITSLILFFFSIWQVSPVIVGVQSPLGLASHLAPSYWAGLLIIVMVSIITFLDRRPKSDAIYLLILAILSQILLGVVSFVYENPRSPDTYFPITEVYSILNRGGLDIVHPPTLPMYYSWPALHFISAFIANVAVGESGFLEVVKYTPVVFSLILVLITYSIGKRLELTSNLCFILSFLSITSWLFLLHYGNNAVGMLFYLLLFMMLLKPKNSADENLVVFILFGGLIMMHSLASLAALGGLIALSVYRKETRLVLPSAVLFAMWYLYVAFIAAGTQARLWLADPLRDILELARIERYQEESVLARTVARYSQLSYVALYAVLTSLSMLLVFRRRPPVEHRRQVTSILMWMLGSSLVLFSGYGQILARGYVFAVVPAVCVAVLALSRHVLAKALLVGAMLVTVALSLPANFGAEASWAQVLTTELKGSMFFAIRVHPQPTDSYFQQFPNGANLILAYDSSLFRVRHLEHATIVQMLKLRAIPAAKAVSALDDVTYVILSRSGRNAMNFRLGGDPYAAWPESAGGRQADQIYENGDYQIFRNRQHELLGVNSQSSNGK
jgi:hypothetical protein